MTEEQFKLLQKGDIVRYTFDHPSRKEFVTDYKFIERLNRYNVRIKPLVPINGYPEGYLFNFHYSKLALVSDIIDMNKIEQNLEKLERRIKDAEI